MRDFEKFKEKLPSIEKFQSLLKVNKLVTKNMNLRFEFGFELKVLNLIWIKTIKDYHDLYLKYDVLLLADVLEKLRNNNLKNYGLYPSHYLIRPTSSWDAMITMTKFKAWNYFRSWHVHVLWKIHAYIHKIYLPSKTIL